MDTILKVERKELPSSHYEAITVCELQQIIRDAFENNKVLKAKEITIDELSYNYREQYIEFYFYDERAREERFMRAKYSYRYGVGGPHDPSVQEELIITNAPFALAGEPAELWEERPKKELWQVERDDETHFILSYKKGR